jgi:hypothetical protein
VIIINRKGKEMIKRSKIFVILCITISLIIIGGILIYNPLKEISLFTPSNESSGAKIEGGQETVSSPPPGTEGIGTGGGSSGGGSGRGSSGSSPSGGGTSVPATSDQTICQNAQNNNLCDGLDITYGEGYRTLCCSEHNLCC